MVAERKVDTADTSVQSEISCIPVQEVLILISRSPLLDKQKTSLISEVGRIRLRSSHLSEYSSFLGTLESQLDGEISDELTQANEEWPEEDKFGKREQLILSAISNLQKKAEITESSQKKMADLEVDVKALELHRNDAENSIMAVLEGLMEIRYQDLNPMERMYLINELVKRGVEGITDGYLWKF
ncbi:MAG: hypothetical protein V1808_01030 [Candidatus Daviesbacteria bacterium]